jgi:hypothetical protein
VSDVNNIALLIKQRKVTKKLAALCLGLFSHPDHWFGDDRQLSHFFEYSKYCKGWC